MNDKQIEEKIGVIHNIAALGFSIPANMAMAIIHVMVELITDKLPLEKDFLLTKALVLLKSIYLQLSRDPKIVLTDFVAHPSF